MDAVTFVYKETAVHTFLESGDFSWTHRVFWPFISSISVCECLLKPKPEDVSIALDRLCVLATWWHHLVCVCKDWNKPGNSDSPSSVSTFTFPIMQKNGIPSVEKLHFSPFYFLWVSECEQCALLYASQAASMGALCKTPPVMLRSWKWAFWFAAGAPSASRVSVSLTLVIGWSVQNREPLCWRVLCHFLIFFLHLAES